MSSSLSLDYDDLKVGMYVWVKDEDNHKATKVKILAKAGMVPLPESLYGPSCVIFPVVIEKGGKKVVTNYSPCCFYKYKCLLEKDRYAIEL